MPASPSDNLGPLTTTFTGPSTCLATTTWIGNVAGFYVAAFWEDVTECYPTGTKTLNLHTGDRYWSPGICPSGWTPAVSLATDYKPGVSGYDPRWVIASETTAWLCCPSGLEAEDLWPSSYRAYTDNCRAKFTRGQTITNVWNTADPPGQFTSVEVTGTIPHTVLAKGIQIMWQSSDKVVVDWWSTASPTGQATATSTSTRSSVTRTRTGTVSTGRQDGDKGEGTGGIVTPPPINTGAVEPVPSSSDGLSTGAKAGVGVAAGIGAIGLAIGVYALIRLLRAKGPPKTFRGPQHAQKPYKQELPTASNVPEMEVPRRVYEVPA
ncbi:hypothetical protein QBC35DRAFT_533296 [Podospora australis]|uniref:Uncharacterized protein n=1 Tax=Podospora australis TaxID=1536484 RepID=A0AAN6WQJ4_9PEZI|nr:hypothetical protein QBC35DRAFT_533296 [Podospora australis]